MALAWDLWGLDISPGMVSKLRQQTAEALLLPWVEVALHVRTQNVNIDETPWREGKRRAYLWGVVAPLATLFRIAYGRTRQIAETTAGQGVRGRGHLRPPEVVLVDQAAAVVLGASAAGLPGDD